MNQRRILEVGEAALPSQRIQHKPGAGELLAQRQPVVNGFLRAPQPEKYQMDRLYAEHHGDEDRSGDDPKIAQCGSPIKACSDRNATAAPRALRPSTRSESGAGCR